MDQKKKHFEEEFTVLLEEKDQFISVLQTQIIAWFKREVSKTSLGNTNYFFLLNAVPIFKVFTENPY